MFSFLMSTLSANVIQPAGRIVFQAATEPAPYNKIGFIVIGIIVVPVILLSIAGIFEFPKKSRVPELFGLAFFLLVGALIASFAVLGFVLKFAVPQ